LYTPVFVVFGAEMPQVKQPPQPDSRLFEAAVLRRLVSLMPSKKDATFCRIPQCRKCRRLAAIYERFLSGGAQSEGR
jgi:hypothetical protein